VGLISTDIGGNLKSLLNNQEGNKMLKLIRNMMLVFITAFAISFVLSAQADERAYQVSPSGSVRYDLPSYVTKTSKNGTKKTYEVSPSGSVRYDKPSLVTKPSKKI